MFFVYILESIKNSSKIYIGASRNIDKRLIEHNSGIVPSTKPYTPWKIKAYVCIENEVNAFELEKYFKTGSGKAFIKKRLIG